MAMKSVVIVGGGISGSKTAQALKGKANITIVQAESFVEWQIAATYTLTTKDGFSKAVAPLEVNKLPGVTYVISKVTKLDANKIVLSSGQAINFDYCVLCLGYSMPVVKAGVGMDFQSRKSQVDSYRSAILEGKSIVVVGGGPVAVELAADIREANKGATVKMVCRGKVLAASSEKYQLKTTSKLKEMNIEVMTDEFVDAPAGGSFSKGIYKLKSGGSVECDVLVPSYSTGSNTGFLQDVSGMLDSKGNVAVNEFMQSTVNPAVFAVGCSSVNDKEFVGIPKIEGQVKTASANLKSLLAGKACSTKHAEGAPFMKAPMLQPIGHNTFAWLDPSNAPPPVACCARIGFPCCPLPICWCCLPPCCCGGPCADPEGKQLAGFTKGMMYKSAGFNGLKGFGQEPSAPEQQMMS